MTQKLYDEFLKEARKPDIIKFWRHGDWLQFINNRCVKIDNIIEFHAQSALQYDSIDDRRNFGEYSITIHLKTGENIKVTCNNYNDESSTYFYLFDILIRDKKD